MAIAENQMKVEVLVPFKHSDPDTNMLHVGIPEEVWVVGKEFGEYGCSMGWFKDMSGQVETKKPDPTHVVLAPNSTVMGIKTEKVNG